MTHTELNKMCNDTFEPIFNKIGEVIELWKSIYGTDNYVIPAQSYKKQNSSNNDINLLSFPGNNQIEKLKACISETLKKYDTQTFDPSNLKKHQDLVNAYSEILKNVNNDSFDVFCDSIIARYQTSHSNETIKMELNCMYFMKKCKIEIIDDLQKNYNNNMDDLIKSYLCSEDIQKNKIDDLIKKVVYAIGNCVTIMRKIPNISILNQIKIAYDDIVERNNMTMAKEVIKKIKDIDLESNSEVYNKFREFLSIERNLEKLYSYAFQYKIPSESIDWSPLETDGIKTALTSHTTIASRYGSREGMLDALAYYFKNAQHSADPRSDAMSALAYYNRADTDSNYELPGDNHSLPPES